MIDYANRARKQLAFSGTESHARAQFFLTDWHASQGRDLGSVADAGLAPWCCSVTLGRGILQAFCDGLQDFARKSLV